jgi:adenylate kinase
VHIILLGAPGSGKGTQANFIKEAFKIPAFSTGDLLREVTKKLEDPLAKKISDTINKGLLVTNDVILEILARRLQLQDAATGFILDGFPRSLEQAKLMDKICKIEETFIINLELDLTLLIKRLTGRFTCDTCNSLYNKFFAQPQKEGICDKCGKDTFTYRSDDEISIIEKRIEVYQKETIPVIEYYKDLSKKGLIKMQTFDATLKPQDLFKEISSFLS